LWSIWTTWTASWPVADRAIINASPLIFLSRAGYLDLLRIFASEVWVPEPVAWEIRQRGAEDITARMLDTTDWLSGVPAPNLPSTVADWRLGAGESSVLALALQHPGTDAIIDDLAARKCAASLSIPVRGTLGIVLVAKQRGAIHLARPVIEKMLSAGLYLSQKVLDAALSRVGE
jgi:predicted nucleic acid-binding protein